MRLAYLTLALVCSTSPLAAQELERPARWKVRFDRPAPDTAIYFVTMPPGWHITTGPAAILYDPSKTAQDEYRVQSEISLFPGERREGFGLLIGGADLQAANQSYLYFLIRKDGRFLVKHRAGSETHVIIPWTEHSAIIKHDGGEGEVKNVLAIECGAQQVRFFVNDQLVAWLPRSEMDVDGIVGLRVNHSLNVHVTNLTVEPLAGDTR
ncbi:MAG: hypothetical protein JSW46_08700 [Gemmatimonadota bacterium]|nr:MAG: hypothetical protein JSW46_08700 [Gemmatimonadota bacterium]